MDNFAVHRPWTPNSGSDILLSTHSMAGTSKTPPGRLYQKRIGKLQRLGVSSPLSFALDAHGNPIAPVDFSQRDPLDGGLSWTTTSSDHDHIHHQLSSQSFDSSDNRGRYRSQSLSSLSPVMIKNHSRGKMNLYPGKDHFYSHALTLETQLKEFFTSKQSPIAATSRQDDVTNNEGASLCISVLESMAERPGPYQVVLLTLKAHLSRFIFAEIPRSPSSPTLDYNSGGGGISPNIVKNKDSDTDERACANVQIPYFDMCKRLKKEIQRLESELADTRSRLCEEEGDDVRVADVHAPSRPRTGADPNSELYDEVKAKEEEIRRLFKETGDLKKVVMEQMDSMRHFERQLEEQARRYADVNVFDVHDTRVA
jgi:hypothetical protein